MILMLALIAAVLVVALFTIPAFRTNAVRRVRLGFDFLTMFASEVATSKYVPKMVNLEGMVLIEYEVQSAIAAAQTLTLTLPAGVSPDMVPLRWIVWSNAQPRVRVIDADLLCTSHNTSTGVTVFTAVGGGVPDNSTLSVLYMPSTIGT